jgi:hypothetical protein
MSQISKRLLLGLGAACLIMESVLIMPASAGDSVSLTGGTASRKSR